MKAFEGRRGIASTHSQPRHEMGWVVSVTPRPRFRPGERTPGTHCTEGWVGPRAGLDAQARGKIISPLPGIEPRSPGRPARSLTELPGSPTLITSTLALQTLVKVDMNTTAADICITWHFLLTFCEHWYQHGRCTNLFGGSNTDATERAFRLSVGRLNVYNESCVPWSQNLASLPLSRARWINY
jgi:hypothetical protein